MGRLPERLRNLDRHVLDGDHAFGRMNRRGEAAKRAQYEWAGRNWLLILLVSVVAIGVIVAFGHNG